MSTNKPTYNSSEPQERLGCSVAIDQEMGQLILLLLVPTISQVVTCSELHSALTYTSCSLNSILQPARG
jgi:hypothetical protein